MPRKLAFLLLLSSVLTLCSAQEKEEALPAKFSRTEVMVPMRDGIHLQTAIFVPLDQTEPLPILLRRTPYGIFENDGALQRNPEFKELVQDGYIFVFQNLRGRFKSEGTFNMSSAPGRQIKSQKHQRRDRCLRHYRLAGQERCQK